MVPAGGPKAPYSKLSESRIGRSMMQHHHKVARLDSTDGRGGEGDGLVATTAEVKREFEPVVEGQQDYVFKRHAMEKDPDECVVYGYVFDYSMCEHVNGILATVYKGKKKSVQYVALSMHEGEGCGRLWKEPRDHMHMLVYFNSSKPTSLKWQLHAIHKVNSDTQFNELNKTKQKLSPFSKTVYLVSNLLCDFLIHFVMSISPFTPAIFAAILGLIHHVTITISCHNHIITKNWGHTQLHYIC